MASISKDKGADLEAAHTLNNSVEEPFTYVFEDNEESNERSTLHNKNILFKFVSGREYNINLMHQILTKAWRPSRVFTITDIGSGIYNVRFSLLCDLIAFLQGTPWSVKEYLMLIERGNEEFLLEYYDFKYVVFSLHIYGLPLSMLNAAKVFSIVSIFGTPEPIDPAMAAKWGKFAKVRVRLDITKPLPKDMEITLKSKKKIKISFRYEKVPRLCFHCGYFGHIMKQCLHLSKKLEEDTSLSTEDIMLRMDDRSYARYNEEIRAFYKTIDDEIN
ncbi:uncharacterized protein LOC113324376 [Papaver somniferum]|uniref:uncharacterized protein LOC113324376 n=1 Tax=Papaver somniferum TaxID=3469 RepID=UPI000E6FDDBE|nr:uncharacterized protein LOC113324376 [Papaver somniferum]